MNKTVAWVVTLVLVIGGLIIFFTKSEPKETGPIKIGFIGPLTGDVASIGAVNKAAVELAVSEVDTAGGIDGRMLEVIYEDGKCDATSAVSAAQKLITTDKVSIILGGLCSTETAAFGPMAMEKKVIVFTSGSSAPNLSKLGRYFFRSYPSDAFQGKFAAEYAYNTLGSRNVAVFYHISDWGTGIKDVFIKRFTDLGGKIVLEEGAPQEATDYRTPLSKLKAVKADLIYAPMYPNGGEVFVKQAFDLGIKTPMFGGDGWDDPKFQKAVNGKGSILYTASLSLISDEFKAKMRTKTGSDQIPVTTTNAYDNVKILAQVLAKSGDSDTDKIQSELRKVNYDGVSGLISFDQNGDLKTANYVVKRIQNGSSVEVK